MGGEEGLQPFLPSVEAAKEMAVKEAHREARQKTHVCDSDPGSRHGERGEDQVERSGATGPIFQLLPSLSELLHTER